MAQLARNLKNNNMNTYNLTTVAETNIIQFGVSTTTTLVPINSDGTPVTDYTVKNRVIKGDQMIIFDTEQEYRDWLVQNQ